MIVDKMEAFRALSRYGIHVARTRYVDSAEDALAFAERRDAPDPRLMPIVLRRASGHVLGRWALSAEIRLESEREIRREYDHVARELEGTGHRILAQAACARGTDIVISGDTSEVYGKTLGLRSATHAVSGMVPIGEAEAQTLVDNFEEHHGLGSRDATSRMLAHLLLKASALFAETPLTQLAIDVRLHENAYTVLDVSMTSLRALHLPERLSKHAHDRKAEEFHPAGRQ